MAQQSAGSNGNAVLDLVCVAVLGLLLWFGAHAIADVTHNSSVHPAPTDHAPPPAAH
jgi:hypothetical protein